MNRIDWEEADVIDLDTADVVQTIDGPARVQGWRWRPHYAIVNVIVIATGSRRVIDTDRVLRIRRTHAQTNVEAS